MRKITCDFCGKDISREEAYIESEFYTDEFYDLCEKCDEKYDALNKEMYEFREKEHRKIEKKIEKMTKEKIEKLRRKTSESSK